MMHNGLGHFGSWMNTPWGFSHGPFGFVIGILFWGLVLYLLFKLLGAIFSKETQNSSSPIDLLKERYAKGEINEDEYHRMKTELV